MVKTALLIIDMQNDFMPGGPLGVPGANEIIPIINALIPKFSLVIATQDWHPADHLSFTVNNPTGGLWPVHCVQGTEGAALVPGLHLDQITAVFQKGQEREIDSYSAFFDNAQQKSTGLDTYLKKSGIEKLVVLGVATEYCVLYSVLDALKLGFSVEVMPEACRGINITLGDEQRALDEMKRLGAIFLS